MGCYICSTPIEKMALDPRDMKTRPCSHCESIIADMVNEADDEYEFAIFDDEGFDEEQVDDDS